MRRAARTDANQARIIELFKKSGCEVESLAALGRGVPDLLIAVGWRLALVEVKRSRTAKLTPAQFEWSMRFPMTKIVRCDDDALAVVAWLKRGGR